MARGRGGNASARASKPAPRVAKLNKNVGKMTMGKPIMKKAMKGR